MTAPHHGRPGLQAGRLMLTTTNQPAGAPIFDGGTTVDEDDNRYGALVVRIPGRRLALVAGWRDAQAPDPHRRLRTLRRRNRTGPTMEARR